MEHFSCRHPGKSLRELDPNVRSLGLVSFFADLGSEIVYPLFPIFVTTVLGAPSDGQATRTDEVQPTAAIAVTRW